MHQTDMSQRFDLTVVVRREILHWLAVRGNIASEVSENEKDVRGIGRRSLNYFSLE